MRDLFAGGPLETVVDGGTGFLCDPTGEAFGSAIVKLARTPNLGERMGNDGRTRVQDRFSIKVTWMVRFFVGCGVVWCGIVSYRIASYMVWYAMVRQHVRDVIWYGAAARKRCDVGWYNADWHALFPFTTFPRPAPCHPPPPPPHLSLSRLSRASHQYLRGCL